MIGVVGLGDGGNTLLNDELQRDLNGRLVVVARDGVGQIAVENEVVIGGRTRSEGRVRLQNDTVTLGVRAESTGICSHSDMILHLIHHRFDLRVLEDALETTRTIVRHPDRPRLSLVVKTLQRLPLSSNQRTFEMLARMREHVHHRRQRWKMYDRQVYVRHVQLCLW